MDTPTFDPNAKTVYLSGCTNLSQCPELPNAEYRGPEWLHEPGGTVAIAAPDSTSDCDREDR